MGRSTYDFSEKVAFVTGGASGIGLAAIRRFSESGASVVIADIDKDAGNTLEDELRAQGRKAQYVELDVNDPDSVNASVLTCVRAYGHIDYAVNSAAIAAPSSPL